MKLSHTRALTEGCLLRQETCEPKGREEERVQGERKEVRVQGEREEARVQGEREEARVQGEREEAYIPAGRGEACVLSGPEEAHGVAQKLVHAVGREGVHHRDREGVHGGAVRGAPRSSGRASAHFGPSRGAATVSYEWLVPAQRRCRNGPVQAVSE